MPNYESYHIDYASETLNWFSSDSLETYNHNVKNRLTDLQATGLMDYKFNYKFNSLGFRCDEFTNNPCIMFLGCSNTVGTGLPQENIWPELLSKKMNMQCANLGISGGSLDTSFRLCHGYIDRINPKIVVLLPSNGIRCEFVSNMGLENLGAWVFDTHYGVEDSQYKNFYRMWSVDNNNDFFNREKNILAIESLCVKRNIKFVLAQQDALDTPGSFARDLQHYGIEAHKSFADKILLKL